MRRAETVEDCAAVERKNNLERENLERLKEKNIIGTEKR